MTDSLGSCLFDHYKKYLGLPSSRRIFESQSLGRSIQILSYDGVFQGCRVFASLGLSHFKEQLGGISEVVIPADMGWDEVPEIAANALFRMVELSLRVGSGTHVSSIKRVAPEFVSRYRKDAIYLTAPYCFPEGFSSTLWLSERVHIHLGMFLGEAEVSLLDRIGQNAFEGRLEESQVDPFQLSRQSIA